MGLRIAIKKPTKCTKYLVKRLQMSMKGNKRPQKDFKKSKKGLKAYKVRPKCLEQEI